MKLVSKTSLGLHAPDLAPVRSATGGWLGRFRAEEAGSMSYFAVAGALVMMVFGGIGIDMIHAELKRNKVQNTLDRAVLAAANVKNEMDPQETVESYFAAMNMPEALQSVEVSQDVNHRQVTATGKLTMPSHLMGLIGVDTLNAEGMATALHGMGNIEVSLVLDISNSMNSGASGTPKIDQLKTAAKSFIDTLLPDGGADSLVTISIVPYNATVNLGADLAEYYNIEDSQPFSNCVTFDESAYSSTAISNNQPLEKIAHFDPFDGHLVTESSWCPTGNTARIVPHSSDAAFLKAQIDGLVANGNTAIDLGVKWGAALLDPYMKSTIDGMVSSGDMVAPVTARPAAFDDTETMKFIVVMTDGENTSQFDLKDDRKYGLSNVWVDDHGTTDLSDDRYSIRVQDNPGTTNDLFLWTHRKDTNPDNAFKTSIYSWALNDPLYQVADQTAGELYNNAATPAAAALASANCNAAFKLCDTAALWSFTRGGGPRRLTNAELYARMGTSGLANTYYWFAYAKGKISYDAYLNAYYAYEEIQNGATADARLATVCNSAKEQGVVVFAIGVEAPARGLAAMSNCASSAAHYYNVSGSQLDETFSAIARTLQTLRLIQ